MIISRNFEQFSLRFEGDTKFRRKNRLHQNMRKTSQKRAPIERFDYNLVEDEERKT